jgi:hypothetical protein
VEATPVAILIQQVEKHTPIMIREIAENLQPCVEENFRHLPEGKAIDANTRLADARALADHYIDLAKHAVATPSLPARATIIASCMSQARRQYEVFKDACRREDKWVPRSSQHLLLPLPTLKDQNNWMLRAIGATKRGYEAASSVSSPDGYTPSAAVQYANRARDFLVIAHHHLHLHSRRLDCGNRYLAMAFARKASEQAGLAQEEENQKIKRVHKRVPRPHDVL